MICISEDTFQNAKPIYRAIAQTYIDRGVWKIVKPEEKKNKESGQNLGGRGQNQPQTQESDYT